MPELILHHYPTSPFSEKVRLILGFKRLPWKSVVIPMIMPKPDVVALTGGYRKTPILQIGADIYCDTALIADVLERLQPSPTLYPDDIGALARILAQWADSTLFWTTIPYVFQPAGAQHLFANVPPEHIQAFGADRKAFRGNSPRMPVPEATGSLAVYLQRLDSMLEDGRPYLLGALPTIADFAVYHSIWFIRRGGPLARILDAHSRVVEWADGMQTIGHAESAPLASDEAVAIARAATLAATPHPPQPIDVHGIALGERVRVAATDYGMDPVEGDLVLSAANEIALRRTDPRAGAVVVHFPRVGFGMSRAEPANQG
jgi:glutathione S-transferase